MDEQIDLFGQEGIEVVKVRTRQYLSSESQTQIQNGIHYRLVPEHIYTVLEVSPHHIYRLKEYPLIWWADYLFEAVEDDGMICLD